MREIERVSEPAVRSLSRQLIQSLMDLHGMGIERMLEIMHRRGEAGQALIDEMGNDELVCSLLLLYGLHPLDLSQRVLQALEKTRPFLGTHGGHLTLVGVSASGEITLRLEGNGHSCPSSAATLQSTVEQAIYDAAPDATSIVIEGAVREPIANSGFVSLASLQASAGAR